MGDFGKGDGFCAIGGHSNHIVVGFFACRQGRCPCAAIGNKIVGARGETESNDGKIGENYRRTVHVIDSLRALGVISTPLRQSGAIANDQDDVFGGFGFFGFGRDDSGRRTKNEG